MRGCFPGPDPETAAWLRRVAQAEAYMRMRGRRDPRSPYYEPVARDEAIQRILKTWAPGELRSQGQIGWGGLTENEATDALSVLIGTGRVATTSDRWGHPCFVLVPTREETRAIMAAKLQIAEQLAGARTWMLGRRQYIDEYRLRQGIAWTIFDAAIAQLVREGVVEPGGDSGRRRYRISRHVAGAADDHTL